ncbi:contractile injection system tape measure protein [Aquimarina sp. 2304DJ70-9]|uniref:contractile injection system tape measure protein n=1 Tax=Aquimarina penaris TaxID=3231044 RepID=UPI003461E4D6
MANKHLIGKQILEVEVNSSDRIYTIQQTVSELVRKDLLPKLTIMFDEIVGEDEVISLDRIELDIGHINLNSRRHIDEIVTKIIKLLEEKIQEILKNSNLESETLKIKNKNDNSFGLNGDSHYRKQKESSKRYFKDKSNIKNKNIEKDQKLRNNNRQSLRRYYFDLWLYWLEKGRLPPYTIQPEEDWMPLILETLGLDIDAVTILENKLRKHPIALKRLVLQHTAKDLKSVVELYTGFSQNKLLDLCKEVELLFEDISPKMSIHQRTLEIDIWEHIFKMVILDRKKLESLLLGIEVIKLPSVSLIIKESDIRKIIKTESGNRFSFLHEILQQETQKYQEEKETSLLKDDEEIDNFIDEDTENEDILYNEEQLESPQFFSNTGIVLLHPFLNSFFRNLELLEGKDFIDFNARSKAVMLLHFLATAEETPKEYEMVLPKFLCEMPVNMPLDHTVELTKQEKEEANNLLQAVIEHWGVLGGTSPDGLREGFLMREGKLEKEQTGWKLFVEQKTLDILLDRLPWNLSLIKLPWMKEILRVEWR